MKRFWLLLELLNTRMRLLALLLLVIVPFTGLLGYGIMDRYRLLRSGAEYQVLHLAQAAIGGQNEIVSQTRQLLATLANNPTIRNQNWPECEKTIEEFWQYFQTSYANFHVATPDGEVRCSATSLILHTNISDRRDFQDALASKSFVFGDLVVSRTTGLLSVNARYPVVEKGKIVSVISAQISVDQLANMATPIALPKNGEILMTDRMGKVIVRQPPDTSQIGLPLKEGSLREALHRSTEEVVEANGTDGVARIYGVTRTSAGQNGGIHLAVGFPVADITQEIRRNLLANVLTMSIIILCVLVLAWIGADVLVLRKIQVLVATMHKLREGRTEARTGLLYGRDELSHIARAIDETAAELERILFLLREQTIHDPLTSLYNRRYLSERLNQEFSRAGRNGKTIGIIMADIDHFKRINDGYGHDGGDKVLIAVANTLLSNVRGGDIVCRYGGEEFAIVMPGASLDNTQMRAELLRVAVSKIVLEHEGEQIGPITISMGVALFPDHGKNSKEILRQADAALYEAKGAGRNRVVTASAD